jgi:hypothetical protein
VAITTSADNGDGNKKGAMTTRIRPGGKVLSAEIGNDLSTCHCAGQDNDREAYLLTGAVFSDVVFHGEVKTHEKGTCQRHNGQTCKYHFIHKHSVHLSEYVFALTTISAHRLWL